MPVQLKPVLSNKSAPGQLFVRAMFCQHRISYLQLARQVDAIPSKWFSQGLQRHSVSGAMKHRAKQHLQRFPELAWVGNTLHSAAPNLLISGWNNLKSGPRWIWLARRASLYRGSPPWIINPHPKFWRRLICFLSSLSARYNGSLLAHIWNGFFLEIQDSGMTGHAVLIC